VLVLVHHHFSYKKKILEMSFSVEHLIINYRWLLVCFFLLPASLLYNIWNYIRNFIVFNLSSAPGQHVKKVKEVQHQVITYTNAIAQRNCISLSSQWHSLLFQGPGSRMSGSSSNFRIYIKKI
jgi:hypothetical protein